MLVLVVEYRTPPDVWAAPPSGEAQHMGLTRGAVAIELPLALPERLDRSADAWYMVARIGAWPSLVNGYSGYYPPDYLTLADRIRLFPDDRAIREIARIGVTVLAVHERFYGPQFKEIVDALERRDDVERVGQYQEDQLCGGGLPHCRPMNAVPAACACCLVPSAFLHPRPSDSGERLLVDVDLQPLLGLLHVGAEEAVAALVHQFVAQLIAARLDVGVGHAPAARRRGRSRCRLAS